MKLSLNTDFTSFILNKNLNSSTNVVNQAIQRLTSGIKINSAKDNAANHAIIADMTNKISSLTVAEENAVMGLDAAVQAADNLELMNNIIDRLRILSGQASNGTCSEDSRKIINMECEQLVEEFNNIKNSAAYENMGFFNDYKDYMPIVDSGGISTVESAKDSTYTTEEFATLNTYLKDILDDYSNPVIINNSDRTKAGEISITETMKISDLFDSLSSYGITGTIDSGIITLNSVSGAYITGATAAALGLDTTENTIGTTAVTSTLNYSETRVAEQSDLLVSVGASVGDVLNIRDGAGTLVNTIQVNSTMSIDNLCSQISTLSSGNLSASFADGVITIAPTNGYYVDGSLAEKLSIGLNTTTSGAAASSSDRRTVSIQSTVNGNTTLGDLGIGNTSFIVRATDGTALKTVNVSSTTDFNTLINTTFQSNTITASLTDGVLAITGGNVVDGELATLLGLGVASSTTGGIVGTVITSSEALVYTQEQETEFNLAEWRSTLTNTYDVSSTADGGSVVLDGTTYIVAKTRDTLYSNLSSNKNVILGSDIDLSGGNWTPINDYNKTFNGNGFIISNLTVDTDAEFAGMFGSVTSSATISNIALDTVSVTTSYRYGYAGGLVAYSLGSISNCAVYNATVNGDYSTGGLVAFSYYSSISNCAVYNATVNDDYSAGGLVGDSYYSSISNCAVYNATVSGTNKAGGLVGDSSFSSISNCAVYNATVSGTSDAGGLVGDSYYSSISNCAVYNATVSGTGTYDYAGGLVGVVYLEDNPNYFIRNCTVRVSTSDITGYNKGALIGFIDGNSSYNPFSGNVYDNTIYTGAASPSTYNAGPNVTATSATTFATMGLTSTSGYTVTVMQTGTEAYVTIQSSDTIDDFCNKLTSVGITTTFANGKVTVAATESNYITGMTSYLRYNLNLSSDTIKTTETSYSYITYTATATQTITEDMIRGEAVEVPSVTVSATSTSTLGELGLSSSQNIVVSQNGVESTISVDGSTTIGDSSTVGTLAYQLAQKGIGLSISDGFITLSGDANAYIKSIDTDLSNVIKIEAGEGKTYNNTTVTTYSNTPSATMSISESTTVTTLTTLGSLGINTNQTITVNQAGTDKTSVLTSSSTVGDLINALKTYGINATLVNGIFSIDGSNDSFIKFFGSDLTNTLKLSGNYTTTSSSNTDSKKMYSASGNQTAQESTTFGKLGLSGSTSITVVNNGQTKRIGVSSSTTLAEFMQELASNGITTNFSNGVLTINGTKTSYISGIGSLAPIFGVSDFTSTELVNTKSKSQSEKILHTVDGSTTLGMLGISSASLSVKKDGILKTIGLNGNSTINSMLSDLSLYGITGSISNGKLFIQGGDLNFVSSASNNLVQALNLKFDIADTAVMSSCENIVYGPGTFNIQVGITSNADSVIGFNTVLRDIDMDQFVVNGLSADGTLERLDEISAKLNEKSVELGAATIRLESVLDQINTYSMNLISSRSTLRDTDVASETSNYIKAQILQEASSALLDSTKNLNAGVVLKLLGNL